jgi:hypothetical protein
MDPITKRYFQILLVFVGTIIFMTAITGVVMYQDGYQDGERACYVRP